MRKNLISKGAFFALLLFLFSCRVPCQRWQIEKVSASSRCFNSGRLYLTPQDDFSGLELEITRGESGVRMYINVFSIEIKPETLTQNTAFVEVKRNDEKQVFQAFLYQGGQRLLLPSQARDYIIDALYCNETIIITTDRYQSEITPNNFSEAYCILLNLPIK
jgi:hypothetical protein